MVIETTINSVGVKIMSTENQVIVPVMVGFELLNQIILGYLKIGADVESKSASDVSAITSVSEANISRNSKFLISIGVIDGARGHYTLTLLGTKYAQALDWGKLNDANRFLKQLLQDKPITQRTLAYVDIRKSVDKETLVAQIAIIAGLRRAVRYETGIRGFIDMLVTSGLLEEEKNGDLVISKQSKKQTTYKEEFDKVKIIFDKPQIKNFIPPKKRVSFPINLSFNINDNIDVNNLRKILKVIKEVLLEE